MATTDLIETILPGAFKDLSRRDRKVISQLGTPMTMNAGHEFMHQGEIGRDCALIVSGRVEVVLDGEVVAELSEGDVAGEIALIDSKEGYGTRTASLRSLDEVTAVVFNSREFATLCDLCPDVGLSVARTAVRRLGADLATVRKRQE